MSRRKNATQPANVVELPKRVSTAEERAVLNSATQGNWKNLGDLILKVIAPQNIDCDVAHAVEPPEATTLRHLSMELTALAEGIDQGALEEIEIPNYIRSIADRIDAARELAMRLRTARFGTHPIYGGVPNDGHISEPVR